MLLEKTKIYGVDGVGGIGTALLRTDSAVGLSCEIGADEIRSDFNDCYPWCEMRETVDDVGNVFVLIPKFYARITENYDGTYQYQISGTRYSGFTTLFIDGAGEELDYILVGKYEGSGSAARVYSRAGQTALVNVNLGAFREGCRANGEGYQQYDILIDMIIKLLFTVEFATTNARSIMKGWNASDNTAAIMSGYTDAVRTPSGSANGDHGNGCTSCNTDGHHACKYRGIENLWGNVRTWCDGISFSSEKIFVCADPTAYTSEKVSAPYFYMGNRCTSSGYCKTVTPFEKLPLVGFVSEIGGSLASHYADYYFTSDAGTALAVGGDWNDEGAGLWNYDGSLKASYAGPDVGGRLCFKPI